ncbi:PilZ domain-containing protein [Bacillus bombysepticus]|uniref:PilZ domain-containing protein n=1 Tax=Bacillus bombysepticus TaxID=658666 RepID=UPI00301903F2
MNKRACFRVNVFQSPIRVSYNTPSRSYLHVSIIRDISGNGVSVFSEFEFTNLNLDDSVVLSFHVDDEAFQLKAVCKRIVEDHGDFVYAFQFEEDEKTEEKLIKLLLKMEITRKSNE